MCAASLYRASNLSVNVCAVDAAQRFKRPQRLLRPAEFQRVFAATRKPGKRAQPDRQHRPEAGRSGDHLLMLLWRDNGLGHARLGLAIAKRHIPRAVDRNRIKRQVRESFRRHQQELGSVDIVVLARPDARSAVKAALRASLRAHWKKVVKAQCAISSSG